MIQLIDESSIWVFLLVSVVLGGGASALAGRAIARTWRPWWQVAAYSFILGVAVRFIHFSVFDGTLVSAHYYLVDTAVCMAFGCLRLSGLPRRTDGHAISLAFRAGRLVALAPQAALT